MTNVTDDRTVFHFTHMVDGDDMTITGCGHKDISLRRCLFHCDNFIAFHRGLQRTDRIDLGYHDPRTTLPKRRCRAFANITIASNNRNLASKHHISGAANAINQ